MLKLYFLLIIYLILPGNHLFAQAHPLSWNELRKQQKLLLPNVIGIYRFPGFASGVITLHNGAKDTVAMNYNVLGDEIHCINENGDTLAIADPLSIKFISLQGSRFFYQKGRYLQTITTKEDNPDITLAFNVQYFIRFRYNDYAIVPDTLAGQYFDPNGKPFRLRSGMELRLIMLEYFYFGDKYAHFSKATKNYILEHYNAHQKEIRVFIKSAKIDFHKKDDLIKLLQYCAKLGEK